MSTPANVNNPHMIVTFEFFAELMKEECRTTRI
jgi:hypothetical protein